jgi:CheY-like chemotaxis protein
VPWFGDGVVQLDMRVACRPGSSLFEALRAAETEMPDIIMLDIALPKLDGRDVCQRLRANPKTKSIPILVASAYGGDQYLRDELVDLGADDVVEKPIDLVIAFRKLERIVAAQLAARR